MRFSKVLRAGTTELVGLMIIVLCLIHKSDFIIGLMIINVIT